MGLKRRGNFSLKKSIALYKLQESRLPIILANDAKNHFTKGFRQGGGQTDEGFWKKRKVDPKGGRRGILIGRKGGRLWKSIKTVMATFPRIEIASIGIVYSKRHNEGLDGMPKREFLGESRILNANIKAQIFGEIRKIFK
jgi:hypothetical protein